MLRGPHVTKVLLQRFYDENALTIRSSGTRQKWGRTLRNLQARYPDKRVNEITSDDLRDFLRFDPDGSPRAASGSTILGYRTCVRSFFSWAAFAELVEKDPSAILTRTVPAKAQPTRQHHWLSPDEVSALFDACNRDPNRLRGARDGIVLGLGVFCGLRIHEIAKIAWSDLNLRSSQLFVLGKGGKTATLPIPKQLVELAFEWQSYVAKGLGRPVSREECVLHRMRCLGGPVYGTDRAVDMQWGVLIGVGGLRKIVHARGTEIGHPDLAPHDLRRTYAGLLEDAGVPLREISSLMRHSSVATTETYLRDNPGRWADSVSNAMASITTRAS